MKFLERLAFLVCDSLLKLIESIDDLLSRRRKMRLKLNWVPKSIIECCAVIALSFLLVLVAAYFIGSAAGTAIKASNEMPPPAPQPTWVGIEQSFSVRDNLGRHFSTLFVIHDSKSDTRALYDPRSGQFMPLFGMHDSPITIEAVPECPADLPPTRPAPNSNLKPEPDRLQLFHQGPVASLITEDQ